MSTSFVAALLEWFRSLNGNGKSLSLDAISIWKERVERESELVSKGLKMISADSLRASSVLARALVVADQIAKGEIDSMNAKYDGFPVMEITIGKISARPWFMYVASANSKVCLLLLSEGQQRDEARRRALIWIEKCANRSIHGQPVFVNLLGPVR